MKQKSIVSFFKTQAPASKPISKEENTHEISTSSSSTQVELDTLTVVDDYEKLRADNIRRNNEFLFSIGMTEVKSDMIIASLPPQVNKKRRKAVENVEPKRSSARIQALENPEAVVEREVHEEKADDEQDKNEYNDASVWKYSIACVTAQSPSICARLNWFNDFKYTETNSAVLEVNAERPPLSLKLSQNIIQCKELSAIYSMEFHPSCPNFLLTAGKSGTSGHIALVDLSPVDDSSKDESLDRYVLASFTAHKRWISSAQFLSSFEKKERFIIASSSEDGAVKLWDMSKCRKAAHGNLSPLLLTSNASIHGGKGIFCMDESGNKLLTGSKDARVCVSSVSNAEIKVESEHELHAGVVKSVCWKRDCGLASNTIFATGSQDRTMCVKDTRCGGIQAEAEIEIGSGVHTVSWCPYNEGSHLLMSASYDNVIRVFDFRMMNDNKPLHQLSGHGHFGKGKNIVTPAFLNGEAILTPGEGSSMLSIYCLRTGVTLSRGEMEHSMKSVACGYETSRSADGLSLPTQVVATNGKLIFPLCVS